MFPQLAAQRLVALRLRRKRDPGQELTVRSNDDSSSRFFSNCPLHPYPTRSLVSSVRLPFRNWPRVSAATNPPPIKPTRWLTVLCTVSIRKHRLSWQQERASSALFNRPPFSFSKNDDTRRAPFFSPFDRFPFRSVDIFFFFLSSIYIYIYFSRKMF